MPRVSDTRVVAYEPLLSPAALLDELPLDDAWAAAVERSRAEVRAVLDGADDRLLVVVGPCSIHDLAAALEYAGRLRPLRDEFARRPADRHAGVFREAAHRAGWKGLINDPHLDGSLDINDGLRMARRLLLDLDRLGLPAGTELLDPITPQYIADLVSWGAIGARTTESQIHRQMASGLSMPVGFKNGTDGDVQVAVDAVPGRAGRPHVFRSHARGRRRRSDDVGQPGYARDPPGRPLRPELPGGIRL